MVDDSTLAGALKALQRAATQPSSLHQPFLALFPVSGAAVSTVGELLGSETIAASDDTAARVDELQFDLGEGPCWDAMASRRAVIEPDIRAHPRKVWPAFSPALAQHEVGSLFAFPLVVGPLRVGAVDMYCTGAATLDPVQIQNATAMAAATGALVLRRALDAVGGEYDDLGNASSRRLIHQATGVVIAQLRIPADDARLIIQGQAFGASRTMMEIAQEIIDGRMRFSRGTDGIEVAE